MDPCVAAIGLNVPVLLRVTAQGDTVTCSLPALGVSLTYVDSSFATGGVSLVTFYAKASVEYLRITPL